MKIDLPSNPADAYKEGWSDALNEVIYRINKIRDRYLMPENSIEKAKLTELTDFRAIVESCLDIQSTLAAIQDRK